MDTQTIPGFVPPGTIRQRTGTPDGPTHPVRRHLEAARKPALHLRLKALLRLRLRASDAAA